MNKRPSQNTTEVGDIAMQYNFEPSMITDELLQNENHFTANSAMAHSHDYKLDNPYYSHA